MSFGGRILNVMSFPSGRKQKFFSTSRGPCQEQSSSRKKVKKKVKGQDRHEKSQETSSQKGAALSARVPIKVVEQDDNNEEKCPKDNILVMVRIRPKNSREKVKTARGIVKILESNTLIFDPKVGEEAFYFHGVRQKVHECLKRPNKHMKFSFDHIYGPKATNIEIFEETLKSIVDHILSGFNCSVFAYGATGSGKTHTMLGSDGNPGLTFLVAMELYRRINEMSKSFESEVVVSYLEIYNETLRDLLHPSGILNIREDGLHGVCIPNLTTHRPKDPSEMLELLSSGNSARTQHPTDHNAESSRSHAVFQVSVQMRKRFDQFVSHINYCHLTKAKLVMVDLAGSERGSLTAVPASSAEASSSRHREGANINKSLLALGNCINALADGKSHIPYRDSKLTRLLKDSLGGNCKTIMIANVAPTNLTYDDTYNTLKYADRAKQIRVELKKNIDKGGQLEEIQAKMIADLQVEIIRLRASLEDNAHAKAPLSQTMGFAGMAGDGSKCSIRSPLISQTQVIKDPAMLENFMQLLERKKKNDEAVVKSSIIAKEAEWRMKWKNWRIDAVNAFCKIGIDGENLLQGATSEKVRRLRSQYDSLYLNHVNCEQQVLLARRVLSYNVQELEVMNRTFLNTLKMDEPFLTVTLSEFLYYKSLEREVGSRRCIENYYQQMSSSIFDELLRSEAIVASSINYIKYLRSLISPFTGSKREKVCVEKDLEEQYSAFLIKLCGEDEPTLSVGGMNGNGDGRCKHKNRIHQSTQAHDGDFPSMSSVQDLLQFIQTPVVEYEPPPSVDDSLSMESGIQFIRQSFEQESPQQDNTNCVESSSSHEYSTQFTCSSTSLEEQASATKEKENKNPVSNSSSTSDCHDHVETNSVTATSSESRSSAPFTDPSQTSLKRYNIPEPSCVCKYANSRCKKYKAEHSCKLRKCTPSKSAIVIKSDPKFSCHLNQLSESAIPLRTIPAATSMSMRETCVKKTEKNFNMKPIDTTAGVDIIIVKAPPENRARRKKSPEQHPKASPDNQARRKKSLEQQFKISSDNLACRKKSSEQQSRHPHQHLNLQNHEQSHSSFHTKCKYKDNNHNDAVGGKQRTNS